MIIKRNKQGFGSPIGCLRYDRKKKLTKTFYRIIPLPKKLFKIVQLDTHRRIQVRHGRINTKLTIIPKITLSIPIRIVRWCFTTNPKCSRWISRAIFFFQKIPSESRSIIRKAYTNSLRSKGREKIREEYLANTIHGSIEHDRKLKKENNKKRQKRIEEERKRNSYSK